MQDEEEEASMRMVRTEVRLPPELNERLLKRAERDLRSRNSMMVIAMVTGMDELERREAQTEEK